MQMNKLSSILLACLTLMLTSCIGRNHLGREYDVQGYARMLAADYYYDPIHAFDRSEAGGYDSRYTITRIDDNCWRIHISDTKENSKHLWAKERTRYSSDVTLDITAGDNQSEIINISGTIIEDDFTVTISTPGSIINRAGNFRVDISMNGIYQGYAVIPVDLN